MGLDDTEIKSQHVSWEHYDIIWTNSNNSITSTKLWTQDETFQLQF